MVQVVIFDLGDTLVDGIRPFPHVVEALAALREFHTAETRQPLELALVSDFTMAPSPPPPARVEAIFADYLAILDGFGLLEFFRPAERHVTLSTHAGVMKPDERIYHLALDRLGSHAQFADCLSITENAAHVAACRSLGMQALQSGTDFTDWSEVPLLVRQMIDPLSPHNTVVALSVWFQAHHGVRALSVERPLTATAARVYTRGSDEQPARLASVTFDAAGRVSGLDLDDTVSDTAEARAFEDSLREHGQLADTADAELPPGATHRVVTDEDGQTTVRRDRFSAI